MDERLHWILSLSALSLWVFAVLALYFFVLREYMISNENQNRKELAEFYKTRRQRYLETIEAKKYKDGS
jgi:hypothetical protein